MEDVAAPGMPRHVTLVHGTWGSRSKWSMSGSLLRQALEAEGATCHQFVWSGGNSHRARSRAADELARHLGELQAAHPSREIAVVAHSHGGNVALHATRRLTQSRRVKTVTLGTPYLFAREGKPSTADTVVSWLVAAYVFGLLLVVALGPDKPMGNAWSLPLSVLAGAALVLRFTSWAYFRLVHGSPRDPDLTRRLLAEIQTPSTPGADRDHDLLVIRAADDEAGGLLAFAQFSGWVSFTAARFARPVPLILGLWVGGFLLYAAESWLAGDEAGAMGPASGFLADWTFVIFSVCVLLLALPLLCSLAHGWDGPAVSRFALVTAEASPPGPTTVWQCGIRASRASGLAHASLYDEPEVIGRTVHHVLSPL